MTKSQLTLLKHLATGATLEEIAKKLNISYNTVKTRTKLLYKKFRVNNRKDLIFRAIQLRIIPYSFVKPKFRKRFIKKIEPRQIPSLQDTLSEEEIAYLLLKSCSMKIYEIRETMHLVSAYHERYIHNLVCSKLNARNIIHAITNAIMLGII